MAVPTKILTKKADKARNRIILPKKIIDKWGNKVKMEVYPDKLILKPAEVKDGGNDKG